MTNVYRYPQTVVIITDDLTNATQVAKEMVGNISVEVINWDTFRTTDLKHFDIPIIDVNIGVTDNVTRLKKFQRKNTRRHETVFSVDRSNHAMVAQLNALGVYIDVKRPLEASQLLNVIIRLCNKMSGSSTLKQEEGVGAKKSSEACLAIADLMDSFVSTVRRGEQLPVEEMRDSSRQIIDAIENADMDTWLKAVRAHSSFTYRHVMIVTGFSAAFANALNLPYREKERLTLGALVHDIGKVKIAPKILDKPGKLTPDELEKMRRHPAEGAAILRRDSRMSAEVIAIARSHHEYLDGSGYPDGLTADAIPDIVRVMTVIDIFSALVEARSYKESMKPADAYKVLVEMGAKLDQDIVRAFEPIALDKESHRLVQRLNGNAA